MITPLKVDPDLAAKSLRIVWADGRKSEIPFARLREECPCAKCKAARDTAPSRVQIPLALTTKLLGWRRVGNYALHFSWGDSHSDGIFTYEMLREMT